MAGNNSITSKQMAIFTFITQTGVGIITLPAVLVKDVGHDGWISVLMTGVVAVLVSTFIMILLRRYRDKNIYDINQFLFGRLIGFVLNCLLILYLLLAAIGGLCIFTKFMRITLNPNTPAWVLAPLIILPSIYLVWNGLKPVCRFLYFTLTAYPVIILYMLLIHNDLQISFILPIGEAGLLSLLTSIKTSFFAFIGLELIVFLYPEIVDPKNAFKWHLFASLISLAFFLMVILFTTTLFGPNLLGIQTLPLFNIFRVYNSPIFERVDLYLVGVWFMAIVSSLGAYIFTAYFSLQKVFGLKKSKPLYILYFVMLILLSQIARDINEAFQVLEIVNYTGIGVSIFLVACLSISFFRKKGVKAQCKTRT